MKNKIGLVILLFGLSLLVGYKSAYALFSDSVNLVLNIGTADYEIDEFDFKILREKPLIVDNVLPNEWSSEGIVKLRNRSNLNPNAYFYITETDGNICEDVNIKLEVSESEEGSWNEIYEGEIEELRGDNDKIQLNISNLDLDNYIFIRQKVQLDENANKNSQGMPCEWDEIFTLEQEDKDYIKTEKISRNILTAYYWLPPEVELKDPNENKEYKAGETMNIKWKAKSPTKDKEDQMKIKLILLDESKENEVMTIAEDLENDGKYDWEIPLDLNNEDEEIYNIKVEVVDAHQLEGYDYSDKSFTITHLEQ